MTNLRTANLRCRCGQVRGQVADSAPDRVNRVVCLCADCQAFLHHLGRTDLLDAHGGTDIVQVAPDRLSFQAGADQIVGLRLSERGLYRFHSRCCRTPLGNCVGPAMPFVGIVAQTFEVDGGSATAAFGPPLGAIYGKFAVGTPPPGSTGLQPRLMLRAMGKVLGWKLGGHAFPHPFFDRQSAAPTPPITVLSPAERAALRPLCGPKPA